jgi:hypothetical protein
MERRSGHLEVEHWVSLSAASQGGSCGDASFTRDFEAARRLLPSLELFCWRLSPMIAKVAPW